MQQSVRMINNANTLHLFWMKEAKGKYYIPQKSYSIPFYTDLKERNIITEFDLSEHPLPATQRYS
jgi:hypothetical protein